jgi:transposase, IS6 family
VIEADHGKLKRRIKSTLGFKSMKMAYATIKGFKLMHALRKGQEKLWMLSAGIRGEVRLFERAFGLGPYIMTEAMLQLDAHSLEFHHLYATLSLSFSLQIFAAAPLCFSYVAF